MWNPFTRYADPFEKQIDQALHGLNQHTAKQRAAQTLNTLLQTNTVILNIWLERRFKNYRYLSIPQRRQLYINAAQLGHLIDTFTQTYNSHLPWPDLFQQAGVPWQPAYLERFKYIEAIMAFLKPGQRYHYIKSASFGQLLRDPQLQRLQGDCNQIVTLYAYLYSLRYPITDLQIKLLPEHVCLHLFGIDIEATAGTATLYPKYDYIAPISELMSVNMLDVNDFRERTGVMSKRTLLKSAEIAYVLSSLRELVQRNLQAAYHQLALHLLQENNLKLALDYAKQSRQVDLLRYIQQEGVVRLVKTKQWQKAQTLAQQAHSKELKQYVLSHQAAAASNTQHYEEARRLYQKLGDTTQLKNTYILEFNQKISRIQGLKTLADAKKHKADYKLLLQLAQKGGLTDQARSLQETLKKL